MPAGGLCNKVCVDQDTLTQHPASHQPGDDCKNAKNKKTLANKTDKEVSKKRRPLLKCEKTDTKRKLSCTYLNEKTKKSRLNEAW